MGSTAWGVVCRDGKMLLSPKFPGRRTIVGEASPLHRKSEFFNFSLNDLFGIPPIRFREQHCVNVIIF